MRLFLCIATLFLFLQCKSLKEAASVENLKSNTTQLYLDALSQLYTISPNNTIVKQNKKREFLFEYSDNTLGPISVFDVSNPLQILVFHEAFQIVKIFDRTLTLNGRIDLNKLNLFEVKAVASGNDNRIWIFDELNQELLKIDKSGKIQGRNNDLRLRLKENAAPYRIIEFQNKVYLFDIEHGILIFNAFGEYIGQRAFSNPMKFNYSKGKLFYLSAGDLVEYNLTDGTQKVIELPEACKEGEAFYRVGNELIYMENNIISIQSI